MAFEEDDLDDLDNLMGDSKKKVSAAVDDEDDFFGGGNNDDDDYVPKKKKGKAKDDPLAHLKAAQEEKEGNALKKAMMEKE